MVTFYFLLTLFLMVTARFKFGPCPDVELQANFDINQYLGTWYEQARASSIPFQTGECDTQELSLTQSSKYVQVHNSELRDGKYTDIQGEAYCDGDTAHCHVSFGGPFFGDYRVVSTDYTGYTFVYSCTNFYIFHLDYLWFMTRDRAKTAADYDLQSYLDLVDYDEDDVRLTDQKNCSNEELEFA